MKSDTVPVPDYSRPVRPRPADYKPKTLPIIAYSDDGIYRERDNSYHAADAMPALIETEPASLIVSHHAHRLLRRLNDGFAENPRWQFLARPIETMLGHVSATSDTQVSFFGFIGESLPDGPRGGKRRGANRYHRTLDPRTFAKASVWQLMDISEADAAEVDLLYLWARNVREFCARQRLDLRPTVGAVSSQFLRDPRFYPRARRKVPAATNAKARPHLPGNHYRFYIEARTETDAYYFDQIAAHHSCASEIVFPHADRLFAVGNYHTLADKGRTIPADTEDRLLSAHGLFLLKLNVPPPAPGSFPPPWAEKAGTHARYVYSNELPLLRQLGVGIDYIIAAWVSIIRDTGLNRYAKWALDELGRTPAHSKGWIKPLLLATYGILATKPRAHVAGYAKAVKGTPKLYPGGGGVLPVMECRATHDAEPSYTNVIQRGMIEAETRLRSLALAHALHARHKIIAVYADSVFVSAYSVLLGQAIPCPVVPAGWKLQETCTRLRFFDEVSFTSDQLTKMPGRPVREVDRLATAGPIPGTSKLPPPSPAMLPPAGSKSRMKSATLQ